MEKKEGNKTGISRRRFLGGAAGAAISAALFPKTTNAKALSDPSKPFDQNKLQVWSCGGLAEAFIPASKAYKEKTGIDVNYTGAFAAALGKSLLGSATTEVFAGRVLALSQKLRKEGKMAYFKPLCFTRYVLVTPVDNPAGISDIMDMAKPGIQVVLAPEASPPGGGAVMGLLKKAGIQEQAMKNAVIKESCVQRAMGQLIEKKGDVSIVEYRVTQLPGFKGKTQVIPIPEKFFPPPPLTFTIGVMNAAKDRKLADHYLEYIRSEEGQSYFEAAGFIPAISEKGAELIEKLGVKDV